MTRHRSDSTCASHQLVASRL